MRARLLVAIVLAVAALALALWLSGFSASQPSAAQARSETSGAARLEEEAQSPGKLPYSELLEVECPPPDPSGVERLRLVYRIDEVVYDYGGAELWARPGEANISLIVDVARVERDFKVTFTLRIVGEALYFTNMSVGPVNVTRSVTLLYAPGEGYHLPGGGELGQVFPLFTGGDELVLDMLWARLGERFLNGVRRSVRLRGSLTSVWDLERGVAVGRMSSGSYLVCNLSDGRCVEYVNGTVRKRLTLRGLADNARLYRALRRLRGCGVLIVKWYVNWEVPGGAYVHMEVTRGVPLDLRLPAAPVILEETEVTWQGEKVEELAAWPLAELLGIRNEEVYMRLVDVYVKE